MDKKLLDQYAQAYFASKNNPNSSYDITDARGNVVASNRRKKGFLESLASSVAAPFTKLGQYSGDITSYNALDAKGRRGYQSKYLDQGTFNKLKSSDGVNLDIGNVAKTMGKQTLGVASYGVPVGKAGSFIKNLGLAGGSGAMFGVSQAEDGRELQDAFSGALGGAAGFGAGKVIGAGFNKLSGKGGKVATAAGEEGSKQGGFIKTLRDKSKMMKGAELEVPYGKTAFNPLDTKNSLITNLEKRGLPTDVYGIKQGKALAGDDMDEVLMQFVNNNPNVKLGEKELFGRDFEMALDNLAMGLPNGKRDVLKKFADDLIKREQYGEFAKTVNGQSLTGNKQFTLGDVGTMLQDIGGGLREGKYSGAQKKVAAEIKKVLQDQVGKYVPEYNELSKEYAIYAASEIPTATKMMKGDQSASQSVWQNVLPVSQIKNKFVKTTGNVLDKALNKTKTPNMTGKSGGFKFIGKGLGKVGQYAPGTGRIAGSLLSLEDFGGGEQSIPNTKPPSASIRPKLDEVDTGMQEAQMQREMLYKNYLNQTDAKGKPVYSPKQAQEYADIELEMMGVDPSMFTKKEVKPLSATERKSNAQAKAGLAALNEIEQAYSSGENIALKSKLPKFLQGSTKSYSNAVDRAAEIFGRVQSGGAISKEEEERFKELLPNWSDDEVSRKTKLNSLKQYFADILGEEM